MVTAFASCVRHFKGGDGGYSFRAIGNSDVGPSRSILKVKISTS